MKKKILDLIKKKNKQKIVSLTAYSKNIASIAEINEIVKEASKTRMKGLLEYSEKPLVSIDFNHNSASSIYDSTLTKIINGNLVKVCSWYDNEWGFSNRMLDVSAYLAEKY